MLPAKVFIVPYRDRQNDKDSFLKVMKHLLADDPVPYEIYFAHQCDARPFNRGGMKNIGFLAIKDKYPEAYKEMTFIFHDVDTWASKKGLIDYNTTTGVVKHYYGFTFALGGMFAIKGEDFEKTGGFPNFWGWGMEDNAINDRCLAAGLTIDRSCFYDILDKRIVRTFDGFKRIISKRDSYVYKNETPDDFHALKNMNWQFVKEEGKSFMINISNFDCMMDPNQQTYAPIDIRNTKKLIVPKAYEFRRNWRIFGGGSAPSPPSGGASNPSGGGASNPSGGGALTHVGGKKAMLGVMPHFKKQNL
jgi:hypothetical protein